jgi:hypothetical protein
LGGFSFVFLHSLDREMKRRTRELESANEQLKVQ